MLTTATAALSFTAPTSKVASSLAAAALAGAIAVTPHAAIAAADIGESIFSGNCAACHAGGQNVIMPDKTLEKAALTEYLDGGFNEKAVVQQVTNGKNAMPAFGGRLTDEEIRNVAGYVISASTAGWE